MDERVITLRNRTPLPVNSTALVRRVSGRELNEIANSPTVLPYLNPYVDTIDLATKALDQQWIVLGHSIVEGCCCFRPHSPGVNFSGLYELHYMFSSKRAPGAVKACVDWLFTHTGAQAIYGFTPRDNRAARLLNRWLGGSPVGEQIDGGGRPCLIYELTREQWASTSDHLQRSPARATKLTTS